MLNFSRRTDRALAVAELYRQIVAQARQPAFYAEWSVPDTLDGRFDLIVLHSALVFRRLKTEPEAGDFAQQLFDHMFADMDQSLREMGVGDLSVGKHIKRMAEGFYGRVVAYDRALTDGDEAELEAALRRNLYGTTAAGAEAVAAVARYVRRQAAEIASQPLAAILAGRMTTVSVPEGSDRSGGRDEGTDGTRAEDG